jgi:hypothetical protein
MRQEELAKSWAQLATASRKLVDLFETCELHKVAPPDTLVHDLDRLEEDMQRFQLHTRLARCSEHATALKTELDERSRSPSQAEMPFDNSSSAHHFLWIGGAFYGRMITKGLFQLLPLRTASPSRPRSPD